MRPRNQPTTLRANSEPNQRQNPTYSLQRCHCIGLIKCNIYINVINGGGGGGGGGVIIDDVDVDITLDQCKNELAKTIDNVARKRERHIVIMGKIPKRYENLT